MSACKVSHFYFLYLYLIGVYVSVFTRLNTRWQHFAEMQESGSVEDENRDTQVIAFEYLK